MRGLARGRAGGDRGLGRARAWSRPRRPRRAASAPRSRSRRSRSASGSPTTTSPRSSTWSPRRSASEGRWIHYGLTSSDVLDTALALQLREAGEILVGGARAYRDALVARALRAPRHALRRAHPRRPRRADHLRPAARRLRLRGRPQPRAGSSDAFEQAAVGKLSGAVGTYASVPPAVEARVMERARPARRGRLDPGRAARPPRRAARARSRSPAPGWSASRPRSATSSGPRCARSRSRSAPARRAPRRCRTSATRSSPSGVTGLARVLRGYAQAGDRERRPLARARHLPLRRRAGDPARRDDPARLHAAPRRPASRAG